MYRDVYGLQIVRYRDGGCCLHIIFVCMYLHNLLAFQYIIHHSSSLLFFHCLYICRYHCSTSSPVYDKDLLLYCSLIVYIFVGIIVLLALQYMTKIFFIVL